MELKILKTKIYFCNFFLKNVKIKKTPAVAAGVWAGAVGCHRTGAIRMRYYWPAGSHRR
jgi:hypothetical protein